MAMAASDGTPIPASTTTGTETASTFRRMLAQSCIPWPEPIGDASGITVAAPASSSCRAMTTSGAV